MNKILFTLLVGLGCTSLSAQQYEISGLVPEGVQKVYLRNYETRQVDTLLRAKGIGIFSFDNMNFESFSLETKFASAYSIRRNVRNFNYIILRFISSGAYDSVVNGLTLTYKLNKFNKGVN
jgi:hypothetical protein